MKKIAIHTLGCRTNQLESSYILGDFISNGWEVVKFNEIADIYIINTCTVTGKSDSSSRYYIRQAKKTNPSSKIIVTGCYAQISANDIANMPEVNLIIGNSQKMNLFQIINSENFQLYTKIRVNDIMQETTFQNKDSITFFNRTRANLKIQDGCNYRCSYCIVPYARGKSRSNSIENIISQANNLSNEGFKELVISGIHLGQWGLDLTPHDNLSNLLKELEKIDNLKRYRISSIDPTEFSEDLIETLANSTKFCRHLHISLQSGNNEILKRMNRRYTVEYYSNLINKLTRKIPDLAIGSDIITGFPGETDEQFETTFNNLSNLPISYIHVFSYSRRKGTPADKMPGQVSDHIKKIRNTTLTNLGKEKNLAFRKSQIGNKLEVLVEKTRDKKTGLLKGMSDNFISVLIDGDDNLKNNLVKVTVKEVYLDHNTGEISI